MSIARRYDAINAAIFPGGSRRLRRKLVEAMDVAPGAAVLELGCGSGQVTAALERAGAAVTAVDALENMLERARERAPRSNFILGDLTAVTLPADFDRVVLSFVLHNFDTDGRVQVLERARSQLKEGGSVGILDWALPAGALRQRLWRRFLAFIEPSPSVGQILDGAMQSDLAKAGLRANAANPVAGGRAQILIAQPI